MKPSTNEQEDWLCPETEPPTSDESQTLPAFAGVFRIEALGEEGVPFPTLIDALCEPPRFPDAEIRGKGGCLAQCHPDRARWMPTTIGKQRIEREAHGMREQDYDTVIAVVLADDLAVAS
jgi:hypothetical protein